MRAQPCWHASYAVGTISALVGVCRGASASAAAGRRRLHLGAGRAVAAGAREGGTGNQVRGLGHGSRAPQLPPGCYSLGPALRQRGASARFFGVGCCRRQTLVSRCLRDGPERSTAGRSSADGFGTRAGVMFATAPLRPVQPPTHAATQPHSCAHDPCAAERGREIRMWKGLSRQGRSNRAGVAGLMPPDSGTCVVERVCACDGAGGPVCRTGRLCSC